MKVTDSYELSYQIRKEEETRRTRQRERTLASCQANVRSYFSRHEDYFDREAYVQNLSKLHNIADWKLRPLN